MCVRMFARVLYVFVFKYSCITTGNKIYSPTELAIGVLGGLVACTGKKFVS